MFRDTTWSPLRVLEVRLFEHQPEAMSPTTPDQHREHQLDGLNRDLLNYYTELYTGIRTLHNGLFRAKTA